MGMTLEEAIKWLELLSKSAINWNDHLEENARIRKEAERRVAEALNFAIEALKKVQEPRLLTYEELSTIDGAFIIESPSVHSLEWVFFFDVDTKSDAVWVQGFDGERYIIYREDYGIYVRCWTSRPSEEMIRWK